MLQKATPVDTFILIKIFVNTSLSESTTDIYFEFNDKNAVNQALQYTRK